MTESCLDIFLNTSLSLNESMLNQESNLLLNDIIETNKAQM